MRRNFRIIIEYDGADFHGWQVQPGRRTVQGELERAIETITKQKVTVQGAGRTDAGVHALGQVANFHLEDCLVTAEKMLGGINALTGDDLTVHTIEEVPLDFAARGGVVSKTYRYRIDNGRHPSPLLRRTHLHISDPLSVEKMSEAARLLEGHHDFSALRAADCTDPNPERTIDRCSVAAGGKEITIEVAAKGFLKNMVRIIAGTLILAGRGKIEPGEMTRILESRDRTKAGPTAPAHGLVLVHIVYRQDR